MVEDVSKRPEVKVKIRKKGIWRLIPWGFDAFSQKLLISVENCSNQDIKLVLFCYKKIALELSAGKSVVELFLKPRERREEVVSLKLENGAYMFEAEIPHSGGSWAGYKIEGLNEFRVLESKGIILGLIGLLISIVFIII